MRVTGNLTQDDLDKLDDLKKRAEKAESTLAALREAVKKVMCRTEPGMNGERWDYDAVAALLRQDGEPATDDHSEDVANDLINDMREEWDMEFVEEPTAPVRTYEQGRDDERTAIVTCLETLVRLWGDRDIGVDEINLVERLAVQLQRGDHIPASGKKVGEGEE